MGYTVHIHTTHTHIHTHMYTHMRKHAQRHTHIHTHTLTHTHPHSKTAVHKNTTSHTPGVKQDTNTGNAMKEEPPPPHRALLRWVLFSCGAILHALPAYRTASTRVHTAFIPLDI